MQAIRTRSAAVRATCLRVFPVLGALLSLAALPEAASHGQKTTAAESLRPNILWLSCEDMSPHLGCYGDTRARTPALDRLAREGVMYRRAFCVAGVCAVNRSCIITGVHPTSLGSQHMRCSITLPDAMKCFPEYLRGAGYYCTNNAKTDYNFPVPRGAWDESSGDAHWRNRPDDRPFFAVFNFTTTHESRIHGDREPSDDDSPPPERPADGPFELPPYYPDTPVVRADWDRYYGRICLMDDQVAGILRQLEADGLADETIVFFWSDHGVGLPRAKRWLYDSGTRVPLIVRIPPRFRVGGQGQPGTVDDQLVSTIDFAPTMLHLAGLEVPPQMQGRAFLGDSLSAERRYVFGHRDRMDERYDIIRSVRDARYRYIRNYEPWKPYYPYMNTPEKGGTMRELRRWHARQALPSAAAQFMADSKPLEEFYDLAEDPHEIHNLIDSPEHQPLIERFREAHIAWVYETGDLGLMPEPEIRSRAERFGSEWSILQQPGSAELMARIQQTAALGSRGGAALPALLAGLEDDDATVRYWAAIGLGNLGSEAESAVEPLTRLLQDPAPVTRVAAARALCHMQREVETALDLLRRELESEHEWVRLHAAIVLDEIGEQARPCLPALQRALRDQPNKYITRVANHAVNALLGTENVVP